MTGNTPRPKTLQPTLRKLTESLARELGRASTPPGSQGPEWSGWSEQEWTLARAIAAMHGVSPLLSRVLPRRGPTHWVQFLDAQREHTAKRHGRIEALIDLFDRRARSEGIAALALKGAALHRLGLYEAGDRPMADVDLLVRPSDAGRTAALLTTLGFYERYRTWKDRVFVPVEGRAPNALGEHADNDLKIELHERVCERLPWHITDLSDCIFPDRPDPGVNAYPSMASLLLHLMLHAAGSMTARGLRLVHLHDLALLSSRMSEADWTRLLGFGTRQRRLWWAFPPLELMSRYYPDRVPARVLGVLAAQCPRHLRRVTRRRGLYEASYSYPWVDALPGLEWSRSLGEVLEYSAHRVWPSARQRALRASFLASQDGAARDRWARASQTTRILRWAVSRPVRVFTMSAIEAALASRP